MMHARLVHGYIRIPIIPIGEQPYKDTLKLIETHFGQEEWAQFVLLDHHFFEEDYDQARRCIDQLVERILYNTHFSLLYANIFSAQGAHDQAESHLKRAIAVEPDYLDAYFSLAAIYLKTDDHARTPETLLTIDRKFDIDWNNLRTAPEYERFCQSPYYQEWLTRAEGVEEIP